MTTTKRNAVDRRTFLRSATGIAGIAAAGAVMTPAMVTEAEAYDPGEEQTRSRYQPDSPAVQTFYRTNGYETLQGK